MLNVLHYFSVQNLRRFWEIYPETLQTCSMNPYQNRYLTGCCTVNIYPYLSIFAAHRYVVKLEENQRGNCALQPHLSLSKHVTVRYIYPNPSILGLFERNVLQACLGELGVSSFGNNKTPFSFFH